MGDTGYVTGAILMMFFLLFMFIGWSVHNAMLGQNVNCPYNDTQVQEMFRGNGTALDVLTQISVSVTIFASPCSGLPWWIYIIFIVIVIAIAIWVLPFVGG